jgi:hypothetical protein
MSRTLVVVVLSAGLFTFNANAWLNSLPNRNPHGYKVFLWGGMNVELDIDDLLDEIEARVK